MTEQERQKHLKRLAERDELGDALDYAVAHPEDASAAERAYEIAKKQRDTRKQRDERGQFAQGNTAAKGHGRPRRAIEVEYLADVLDIVTRDRWRAVVTKSIEAAEQGDDKARAWLTRLLLSDSPPTPLGVARRDVAGVTADEEVQANVDLSHIDNMVLYSDFQGSVTALQLAERRKGYALTDRING